MTRVWTLESSKRIQIHAHTPNLTEFSMPASLEIIAPLCILSYCLQYERLIPVFIRCISPYYGLTAAFTELPSFRVRKLYRTESTVERETWDKMTIPTWFVLFTGWDDSSSVKHEHMEENSTGLRPWAQLWVLRAPIKLLAVYFIEWIY